LEFRFLTESVTCQTSECITKEGILCIVQAQANVSCIYASISYNRQNLIAAVYTLPLLSYWSVYSIVITQPGRCLPHNLKSTANFLH